MRSLVESYSLDLVRDDHPHTRLKRSVQPNFAEYTAVSKSSQDSPAPLAKHSKSQSGRRRADQNALAEIIERKMLTDWFSGRLLRDALIGNFLNSPKALRRNRTRNELGCRTECYARNAAAVQ
jgi:hypothetical protein